MQGDLDAARKTPQSPGWIRKASELSASPFPADTTVELLSKEFV
jgi:hypothetical protein